MPKPKALIRELAEHAIAKSGAQQDACMSQFDVLEDPQVCLPGITWGTFFEVYEDLEDEGHFFAQLPVFRDALARHRQKYPSIRESRWEERDGHICMEIPLDGEVPADALKSFIDDAYTIVWNKLDAAGQLKFALAQRPYDDLEIINQLIELHHLEEHRRAILDVARPAILLRTKKLSEAKVPLGASKVGGRPDLPPNASWPTYRDGRPLAFLAQLDLRQVAKLGTPIRGLPAAGLLSVFSVWGWLEDGDPQTPADGTEARQEESGWTVVLHTPPSAELERIKKPRGVHAFKAAAAELVPLLTLPNHRVEPPLAVLGWTEDEYERFDRMQSDFRSVQKSHWLKTEDPGHHQVGGHALFQQEFPREVLDKGLAMLLQIGTDPNAGMCWGDGGELTFYADSQGLAQGRFERVWGTCQGG
jgi:uncharacterized protein YwqG